MRGFLRYDSFLNQMLCRLADCFCLSLMWVLCCIPVITAGAATTALYYAVNKGVRQGDGGIWRLYWHSFRINFKQATLAWLILLPLLVLLFFGLRSAYVLYLAGQVPVFVPLMIVLLGVSVLMWAGYLFPHIATFEASGLQLLKNCQLMTVEHLGWSLLLLAVLAAEVAALVCIPLGLLFVPGVCMWARAMVLHRIFQAYMPDQTAEIE